MSRSLRTDDRAAARLYAHCELVGRMTTCGRSRARTRLEAELGTDMTRTLVSALAAKLRRGA